MSAPTARRVIPGIVTLGLAAGVVLVPNAAFASCNTVRIGGTNVGAQTARHLVESAVSRGETTVVFGDTAVGVNSAIEILDEAGVTVEPELPRQLSPELLNFVPESERPATIVPPRLEQGTPEPLPVEVERQVRPERLALLGSEPEPLPVVAEATVAPPRLEQGTPEPLPVEVERQVRPERLALLGSEPEPLPVVAEATVAPPRLEQGTPEPLPVEVERQVRPERLALLGSEPEPQPVTATETVVPPRLEQGTPEPLPVVIGETLVPQATAQGVPTPLPVETPSVVDQQIPIPATTTAGATVVDTDVDDTIATDEVADAPQSEAVEEGARLAADAPATTLSHTGVDGSTLARGGAGLGAILLGGAMLAIRRVRG